MNEFSQQASIELFHLLLLDAIGRKLDRKYYAVKGGCNLRFFMKSFRYSEDMDLDVSQQLPRHKLKDAVDRIVSSKPFKDNLEATGLGIATVSTPKQTDTSQRWKFSVSAPGSSIQLPTKLEFSRRGMDEGILFEPLDPPLVNAYRLTPFMAAHYSRETAYIQKVKALATRREIQARDLFDIHLLLASGIDVKTVNERVTGDIPQARRNAWTITFPVFKSQVWSYLHPDYQAHYDSADIWDHMVLKVVEALGGNEP